MISNTHTFISIKLIDKQVYRLDDLLVEAIFNYKQGWTLMLVTESGHHVAKQHDSLVAFKLRGDGLWDTIHDVQARSFLGWKRWTFRNGVPQEIDIRNLRFVAENRAAMKATYQEHEIDHNFREIMADMQW